METKKPTKEEIEIEESKQKIKELYEELKLVVEANPQIIILPNALYNSILNKLNHIEDRVKLQTASIMRLRKENQELRNKIKEMKK